MHPPESTQSDDQRDPALRNASLDDLGSRSLRHPESVTAVIRHKVRAESVTAYEQWLKRIVPIAERFPGHRGVHVIRPSIGSTLYTITLSFDTLPHAEDWFQSAARQTLLKDVMPFLSRGEQRETVTGLEFWFHPEPEQKPPKRYKQFLLALSVIFPLTVLVPLPIQWLTRFWPWLGNVFIGHLLIAAVIVGMMTYVIMPRLTRLAARWLYV